MLNTIQKQRHFLSFPQHAVVGASKDQSKFGTKVLKWYIHKPVTPTHLSDDELEGIKTIRSLTDLPNPTEAARMMLTRGQTDFEFGQRERYKKSSRVSAITILLHAPSMISIFAILPPFTLSAICARIPTTGSTSPIAATCWEKYDTIYYSFATPTSSVNGLSLDGSDGDLLPEFISMAHANHRMLKPTFASEAGMEAFISLLTSRPPQTGQHLSRLSDFACKYGVDGVQFDWEYPNNQGVGCNTISLNDTSNFLAFLQELRLDPVGAKLTISAAVALAPFMDATGSPSTDISGFAKVLDYIAVMNYDVWGSWFSTVGPNAFLNDTCAAPANQQGSAVSAVDAWTEAGMPINKIVLGVASYGHSFSVAPSDTFVSKDSKTLAAYPTFNASHQPLGDAGIILVVLMFVACTRAQVTLSTSGASSTMVSSPKKVRLSEEFTTDTTIAPYVYNETSQVMISFDNAQSFTAKGQYIKQTGLRGFPMWEVRGDYNDILLDTISKAVGC
ncbi:glycoside hydrolase [Rhizopogon salebrosus TDB-379]|nr:glycoside hydrolase [Rhizopogon salebrosus TDB-379]